MHHAKKYQIDMCHGSLFRQIFQFSLPLMGANIMSLMFHAADLVVLGQFASDKVRTAATAAVGATSALHVLLLVFFFGFGAGVNSITARYIGAKDHKKVSRTVHTSSALGGLAGILFALLGVLFSRTALVWMSTPADVLEKATVYLQICSLGLPFLVLYTIGAAVLRAVGDTRRPLIYITVAGLVNVLLNLFFVLVCKMDAAGVALATKISNILSAFLVLRALHKSEGSIRLIFRKLRLHWEELKEVLWIGVPAGVQGALYNFSNVFIQSAVNSLGSSVMAGNAASQSLEGIASVASGAFYQTSMSFTGQNFGGKKYKRIIRSILICLLYAVLFSIFYCGIFLLFRRPLLSLYNPDPLGHGTACAYDELLFSVCDHGYDFRFPARSRSFRQTDNLDCFRNMRSAYRLGLYGLSALQIIAQPDGILSHFLGSDFYNQWNHPCLCLQKIAQTSKR